MVEQGAPQYGPAVREPSAEFFDVNEGFRLDPEAQMYRTALRGLMDKSPPRFVRDLGYALPAQQHSVKDISLSK